MTTLTRKRTLLRSLVVTRRAKIKHADHQVGEDRKYPVQKNQRAVLSWSNETNEVKFYYLC